MRKIERELHIPVKKPISRARCAKLSSKREGAFLATKSEEDPDLELYLSKSKSNGSLSAEMALKLTGHSAGGLGVAWSPLTAGNVGM